MYKTTTVPVHDKLKEALEIQYVPYAVKMVFLGSYHILVPVGTVL
jgi:hypothetical protein